MSFAQWNDGAGTFYVDNVMEPGLSVPAVSRAGVIIPTVLLATAGIAGKWQARPTRARGWRNSEGRLRIAAEG